jgi:uncharacterized protein Yka (UPF0111/DUF47 family)
MASKIGVIEQIGDSNLLLPELINRGLVARDRVKYYVALLQAAETYAAAPHHPAPTLRVEREASGIADAAFDHIVPSSRSMGEAIVRIPGASVVLEHIFGDLRQMLQPLRTASRAHPELQERFDIYQHRLDQLIAEAPPCPDDQLTTNAIEALVRRTQNGHDSVHQLAMDLHWELNRLSGTVSTETIDGATAFGLAGSDRTLVRAFMSGVNETRRLKFDHRGLGTTASRDGDRLSIQNDLGLSDVHVIVVHVHELSATVIYTDTHRARIRFFHDLLRPFDVRWDASSLATTAEYEMSVGRFSADTTATLESFLTFLGSRLVFLIDWNRARKKLAQFVKTSEAVALLKWAADNNVGHQAFLQAGDVHLVYAALERAAPAKARFGERLDELLGRDSARLFLMSVLGIVSAGLSAGRSSRLIEDEIEAELLTHLRTTDLTVLGAVTDHATVMATLADHVSRVLTRLKKGEPHDKVRRTVELAKGWETRAGEIVRRSSRLIDQSGDGHQFHLLLSAADSVTGTLEEAAFLLTLMPSEIDPKGLSLLDGLADLVSRGAREYLHCLEAARDLSHPPGRSEIEQFLVTVDQLAQIEVQADDAERAIHERLIHGTADFRELHVVSSMAHRLDRAADALARCGLIVRDYVLKISPGANHTS